MRRVIVVLNAPDGHQDFIAKAKHIAQCLANTSFFPSPNPPLAVLNAHIAALDAAHTAVSRGGKGAAAERNANRAVVHNDLELERAYVRTLAGALPVAEALELIAASGFSAKKATTYVKPPFAAEAGATPGSAHLIARAEKRRATYYWQYSKDGITWISLEETNEANQWVYDLEPRTYYWFRYRVRTKAGLGDWSDPFRLLIP
jgi:hypothetical protein